MSFRTAFSYFLKYNYFWGDSGLPVLFYCIAH